MLTWCGQNMKIIRNSHLPGLLGLAGPGLRPAVRRSVWLRTDWPGSCLVDRVSRVWSLPCSRTPTPPAACQYWAECGAEWGHMVVLSYVHSWSSLALKGVTRALGPRPSDESSKFCSSRPHHQCWWWTPNSFTCRPSTTKYHRHKEARFCFSFDGF